VIKSIIGGAVAVALLSLAPQAAAAANAAPPWVVIPTDTGCRVDLELTGRSGGITPVSLISDGQLVSLRFFKDDLPARAFLPIRIDKQRFSNLMLRGADGAGELVLSEDSEAAMKRGGTLGVAWLSEEPLTAPLGGSERGMQDLRTCGAQVAARHRDRAAADLAARDRAEAEARARALNDAQLAAIKAQAAAADAQRRQVEETAERQRRAEAAAQDQAYAEARQRQYEEDRRRAYEDAQRQRADYGYRDEVDPRYAPPPPRPVWPRPRYPYERY
jgi:hypothetical protein